MTRSQPACCDMLMIINSICFNSPSNWQISFGKEAAVWYFLNTLCCPDYNKLCSILQLCVGFSAVSQITSLNFERTVICRIYIFRLWLTVLLIFSPLTVPHMDWEFRAAHHTLDLKVSWPFSFGRETAENTWASPAGVPLQVEGVFMCL